jgi:hypothetical protein
MIKSGLILSFLMMLPTAGARESDPVSLRWTGSDDSNASIQHVIRIIQKKTGKLIDESELILQESRDLAFYHYQKFQQVAGGYPVEGMYIRIWTVPATAKAVQVEVSLDRSLIRSSNRESALHFAPSRLGQNQMLDIVRNSLATSTEDASIRGIDWKDRILDGQLVRIFEIKSKRGKYRIVVSHSAQKVISRIYEENPQADFTASKANDLDALVYEIYEEVEGEQTLLPRVKKKLTNLNSTLPWIKGDLYSSLKKRRYFEYQYSPILGMTEEGRAEGYWSMKYLTQQAAAIRAKLPRVSNDFQHGFLLHGKYATINIHPDAFSSWDGINFTARSSAPFFPYWKPALVDGKLSYEMVPGNAFYGRPLYSSAEVLSRPARRLENHDPVSYVNDGFDEIQVYYAVNTFMEELQKQGFQDPELSTRPFNAFLFNPDVEYRDNAYYTDDTINFTTYSSSSQNMARDNSTIWHELGHGIMDRLMGENIRLADTGGLSEGMADFLAQIIVQSVTNNQPFPGSEKFRIINQTGFNLTNEVHDDGEAYGGAMNDFMMTVVNREGKTGLTKVADLILDAMRLCRDHPALTAKDWFSHILFADRLGRSGLRQPGELSHDLLKALQGRNFQLGDAPAAEMKLINLNSGEEVIAGRPGSRGNAIQVMIPKTGKERFDLSVSLKSSQEYRFRYPLKVRVEFQKGALQGAIHWVGEELGPKQITLNSESDLAKIPLEITGTCDSINRQDGSCVDYAYIQIWNQGENAPRAKKRFYLQVRNP